MQLKQDTLESDLVILFRRLFEQGREQGKVSLTVQSGLSEEGRAVRVVVEPRQTGCAPIYALAEDGDDTVYVTIGKSTPLEVPIQGGRYTAFQGSHELIALIQAVVAGKFEETVWRSNSDTVKSAGHIWVQDQDGGGLISIHGSFGFRNPLKRLKKEQFKYLPYETQLNTRQ